MLALYHDEPETVTGDIPANVKHHIEGAKEQVAGWEEYAVSQICANAPTDVQYALRLLMSPGDPEIEIDHQIVKYADSMAALAFLNDQVTTGNRHDVIIRIRQSIEFRLAELDWPWLNKLRAEYDLP